MSNCSLSATIKDNLIKLKLISVVSVSVYRIAIAVIECSKKTSCRSFIFLLV